MPFKIEQLPIDGAFLIHPHLFEDGRGVYKKIFHSETYEGFLLPTFFSETSDIVSNKGAIRGLHYQKNNSQAKLIHVVQGKIYDVFVDLRPKSKTFLKHVEILLKEEDHLVVFIPQGCAHGFLALEDKTIFSYQCTNEYDPDSCGGIVWNDPTLNINWPLKDNLLITEKDKKWPTLEEYLKNE